MKEDPDKPVPLESFPTEIQASFVTMALAAHGIEFHTIGELTAQNRCEGPGWVRIFVRACDLPSAKVVLAECRASVTEIDWSQVDVGGRAQSIDDIE